jgi:hypothetical protein
MKFLKVLTILLLLSASPSYAWIFSPSNYDDCISEVVKNAKTELSVQLGVQNCKNKFSGNEKKIKECSVTWNGSAFVRGSPETISRYTEIGILNTAHRVFLPSNMKKEVIEETMMNHMSQIEKFCPTKK